jgi:pseudoazurin
MRLAAAAFAAIVLATTALPALAAEVEVKMLNRGEDGTMVFEPSLIKIAVGDTVKFVPTDKSHNAETIPGMLPGGAEPFKGRISQEISVTFTVPGAYGVKCLPHLAMGMVALVVVGDDPANLEAIKTTKVPPKARERLDADLAELEAQ